MARRTFDDFDDKLDFGLGRRSDITVTMREHYLNDALQKVANLYVHKELQGSSSETLLQGDDAFTPTATDIWWVDHFQNTTSGWQMVPGDMDVIEGQAKRSSPPRRFYTYGSQIVVDTLANVDTNFTLKYTKKPEYWSSGESVLDSSFDALIALWALKLGFVDLRDFDEADRVGREIAMYVAGHKLPLRQEKLNDRGTGIKVRMR